VRQISHGSTGLGYHLLGGLSKTIGCFFSPALEMSFYYLCSKDDMEFDLDDCRNLKNCIFEALSGYNETVKWSQHFAN
jgi:hypothetical protein